jgi:hypothetical protein
MVEDNKPENINFADRNSVEKFLESSKFRPCSKLECSPLTLQHQVLYMPVCLEGRFHREGIADFFEMPLPPRPLSPVTYMSIPTWAPLISCPRDCKGYQNRAVAKALRTLKLVARWFFGRTPVKGSSTVQEKGWWEKPFGILILGILVTVIGGLILRHYDPPAPAVIEQPTREEKKPEQKSNPPATDAPIVQPIPTVKPPKRQSPIQSNPIAPALTPPVSQECAPGANCAMSNGQQGGITAAQIIETPPIRQLTEAQKQGIENFLKTLPQSVLVTVGSVYGSSDGDIYASQFFSLFEGRHYENQTAASIRTGFPAEFTGVFVATTTEDDPAAPYRDALAKELMNVGISARVSNGSKISRGNLELLIGYRPEEVRHP